MVYDCILFFNENDLFEIRLNSQWNFVDKFIVVEAGETHTGIKKPFLFDKKRFEKYAEKIIYVTFDSFEEEFQKHPELIDHVTNRDRGSQTLDFFRDRFQGNYIFKVLKDIGAKETDLVYWSCADEILKEEAFNSCLPLFENKNQLFDLKCYWDPNNVLEKVRPVINFNMYVYTYKINLLHKHWTEHICGTLTEVGNFYKVLPTTTRDKFLLTHNIVPDAGWHFTFLDSTDGEMALQKLKSWAHSKDARENQTTFFETQTKEEAVKRVIAAYNPKIVNISIDTHPRYIVENLDKMQHLIYKAN